MKDKEFLVAILMGTYNGEKFLEEQLDSLEAQEYSNWILYVSDDGSTDGTLDILKRYQKKWGDNKLKIMNGPKAGFCRNFLSLTKNEDIKADYFAWSDQDDIWLPEKLSHALELLAPFGQKTPVLYCTRTTLVNENDIVFGESPLMAVQPPSFSNALVQSLAGANTMVFNIPSRELIGLGYPFNPISHDWWAYQIICGTGGQVIYDFKSTLHYRQHGQNIIGSNSGIFALLQRIKKAFHGRYTEMNNQNLKGLSQLSDKLTNKNYHILNMFSKVRTELSLFQRIKIIKIYNFYRRSIFQQISMFVGFILKKI
ncbi:MAG: glycosyltransferase family 2 protein [Deltaproteobacteria bacterium]|jgi:glycosyltransferase involved in cell wall biosynthesis|nr:glycosyltransferase family 2 protein [Deltaproteobacteria bacterium]